MRPGHDESSGSACSHWACTARHGRWPSISRAVCCNTQIRRRRGPCQAGLSIFRPNSRLSLLTPWKSRYSNGASHGPGESIRPAPETIQTHVAPTAIAASHKWTGEAACVPYRSLLPLHVFAFFNKGPFSMLLCLPNPLVACTSGFNRSVLFFSHHASHL